MNKKIGMAIAIGVAVVGWIGYAEHPTARRLRTAVVETIQAFLA